MKTKNNFQSGFTLVEALLVILILAVIAFGGYYVWSNQHKSTSPAKLITSTITKRSTNSAQPPSPYAGWKTYTLKYEKSTFMYPPTWTVNDQSTTTAGYDIVTLNSLDGFQLSIDDNFQGGPNGGGDPLPLVNNDPLLVTYLGTPAYLVFVNSKISQAGGPSVPDDSSVGSAILLTDPNSQGAEPRDRNVVGDPHNNGVNGPVGSYLFISMGYGSSAPGYPTNKKLTIQQAKADAEYNNGKLVVASMHY